MNCWNFENWWIVETLKSDELLKRWNLMNCWNFEIWWIVETFKNDELLKLWKLMNCWSVENWWIVETLKTDELLKLWKMLNCWNVVTFKDELLQRLKLTKWLKFQWEELSCWRRIANFGRWWYISNHFSCELVIISPFGELVIISPIWWVVNYLTFLVSS